MTTPSTDDLTSRLQGLWLPLITPFRDGELDEASLRRLVRHYAAGGVDGSFLRRRRAKACRSARTSLSGW